MAEAISLSPKQICCANNTETRGAESSALTTKWMTLTVGLIIRSQAAIIGPDQTGVFRKMCHLQLPLVAATANCKMSTAQAFNHQF